MLMKVHPKGQVVIPVEIRRRLGIDIGDMLEVSVGADEGTIELRRPEIGAATELAGAFSEHAAGRPFPSEAEIAEALRRGLARSD